MKLIQVGVSVGKKAKEILISYENADKAFTVGIPIAEYQEWLKTEDLGPRGSLAHIDKFAQHYMEGVINHDGTAELMIERIFEIMSKGVRCNTFYLNVFGGRYEIRNRSWGYRMTEVESGRKLLNTEILAIYTHVLLFNRGEN